MQHEKTKQSKNTTDRDNDTAGPPKLRKDSLTSGQVPHPDSAASKTGSPPEIAGQIPGSGVGVA